MSEAPHIAIDLLRHGEVEGGARYRGRSDDPLTQAGHAQMRAAVAHAPAWKRIVTSPLCRCADFAHALARERALPIHVDARLQEMDFGDWESRSAEELLASDPDAISRFWRDPVGNPPPNGESLPAMQARVLAAWHEIVEQQTPTLVVTHGGPIRIILAHRSGQPLAQLMNIDVPLATLRRIAIASAPQLA